jgi:hypothetical protein
VSNHVSNILTKLQVVDRTQAAVLARDAGLGSDVGSRPRGIRPGMSGQPTQGHP